MSEWKTMTVEECIDTSTPARTRSIPATDYKTSGHFPIIDQGATFIAGWTDDEAAVITEGLPLVVFGDHTRALKYVDFPFARGADGTQLLRTVPEVDTHFFYFALRHVNVPSRGYNRHFTLLRQQELLVPAELSEQQHVALALDLVRNVADGQSSALHTTEALKRAVMHELFTRGLRGSEPQDSEIGLIPAGWELVPFDAAFSIAQGLVDPRQPPYDEMLHLGPDNIAPGSGFVSGCKPAKELGLISGKFLFKPGQIVYSKIRPYLNKVAMPDFEGLCSADMYPLTPSPEFNSHFLYQFLLSSQFVAQVVPNQMRTGIPKVNREELSRVLIPRPGRVEQDEVADALDALDAKIDLHRQKRALYEELFQALLHALMTQEISVDDLDLSALSEREAVPA